MRIVFACLVGLLLMAMAPTAAADSFAPVEFALLAEPDGGGASLEPGLDVGAVSLSFATGARRFGWASRRGASADAEIQHIALAFAVGGRGGMPRPPRTLRLFAATTA